MLTRVATIVLLFGLLLAAGAGAIPSSPRGTPGHAAAIGGSSLVPSDEIARPDPIAIQRIFVPAERLDSLQPDFARGALKKLSKADFEAKVQVAAQMQYAAQNPARIAEATYRATVQTGRITGTAEWLLGHPTGGASALAVDPLPGAVQAPKWADGSQAMLFRATLDGKAQAANYLWVEGPSQKQLAFEWSARLVEQPDEERCVLTFPASPIAALELTMAADRVPILGDAGVLLTGPFPAAKDGERLWKFAFGGQTRLDLGLRKTQPSNEAKPAVRIDRAALWKLSAGESLGQFDFTLNAFRQTGRELVFQVDAGLEILNVSGASVESWLAALDGSTPRSLTVRFREAAPTTRLTISVRSPAVFTAASFTPPQIRVAGRPLLEDIVAVQLSAGWKLDGWQTGDYRLASIGTASDRTTKLEFGRTVLTTEGRTERRPPTVRYRPADQEFNTVEVIDWRLEPNRTKLTATFATAVVRGPISNFTFQASAGYALESVALTPDDPGVAFGAIPGVAGGWFVEPSRAVASGKSVEVRLEFRSVESVLPDADPGRTVPLPRILPQGAGERRGVLAVRPSSGIKVSTSGLSAASIPLAGEPGFSIAYRGREPEGDIRVTRATPTLSASLEVELTGGDSARLSATLRGRAEGTPIPAISVWVPSSAPTWHIEPTAAVNRFPGDAVLPHLPFLGIGNRWSALALAGASAPESGTLWRIAFAKPVSGDFACSIDFPVVATARDLALPHFLGVPISQGTVKLDGNLSKKFRAAVPSEFVGSRPHLILTALEPSEPLIELPDASLWVFRDVKLHTHIDADYCHGTLTGTVVSAAGPHLPITLVEVELESITIDGKHFSATVPELAESGLSVPRPLVPFEVRYRRRHTPRYGGWVLAADSGLASIAGEPDIALTWSSGSDMRAWPHLDQPGAGSARPTLLLKESTVRAAAIIAALLVALPLAIGFALARYRAGWLLGTIIASLFWLSAWKAPSGWADAARPALTVALGSIAIALFRISARPKRIATASVTLGMLMAIGTGHAQAPESAKVYVVPGPAEAPARFNVLVPPATLDKLDALARSSLPDLVALSAEYDCLASGDTATIRAKYVVHSRKTEEQSLVLPLAGVRLENATLDGKEAFPEAGTADRFFIPIRGAGNHELLMQFTVPVVSAGIDRGAKFAVPDLPLTQVGFAAGLRARQLDIPSRNGGQSLRVSADGLRVEAGHGGGRMIRLHWRESGTAEGAKPTIAVKEGAIWDLTDADAALTAAWQFRVEGGTVGSLKFEWPEHALPERMSLEAADGGALGSGIRDWKIGAPANGYAAIEVRLQTPLEGQFTLVAKGYSGKLPTAKPVLFFPRSTDAAEANRDSFHAVRLAGVKSEGVAVSGAIDFPAEAVGRDFAKVPEFNFAKAPPARVVRRAAGKATELRPTLIPNAAFQPLAGEVAYTIGRRIGVEGAMRASAKDSGSVEFDVPAGLILADVWAPDLAGWSRSGARIQAWWTQPVADVIVRWAGQMPKAPDPNGVAEIPLPRWPSALAKFAEPMAVRARPAEGWTVSPLPAVGLKEMPTSIAGEWLLSVEPDQKPNAKFVAKPSVAAAITPDKPMPSVPVAPPPQANPALPNVEVSEGSNGPVRLPLLPLVWILAVFASTVLALFGGRRGRPEAFLLLGLGAVAALGPESWPAPLFWFLAGYGASLRLRRLGGWVLRRTIA